MRYDTNYANKERKKEEGFAVKWKVGEDDDKSVFWFRTVDEDSGCVLKRLRYSALTAENVSVDHLTSIYAIGFFFTRGSNAKHPISFLEIPLLQHSTIQVSTNSPAIPMCLRELNNLFISISYMRYLWMDSDSHI